MSMNSIMSMNCKSNGNNNGNSSSSISIDERMRWCEPDLPRDGGPPTIKNHSVTYHNGTLYCFGGYDGRRNHMTLMIYSLEEGRWHIVANMDKNNNTTSNNSASMDNGNHNNQSNVIGNDDSNISNHRNSNSGGLTSSSSSLSSFPRYQVSGTPPPGRNGHTATLVKSKDNEDARIIIIGGWLGSGPLAASDMHALDVSAGVDNLCWLRIPSEEGTPPGPCNMHSADFVSKKQEVYVFRGGNGREYLNDLHALNVNTHSWRKVETVGEAPQQRANHSSALLEETQELFIFGGWNGKERLNDVHVLCTQTSTWSRPDVGGPLPHPRAGMTLTALRGRLYLFGGSGASSKCFFDLQILDRAQMTWLDIAQDNTILHPNNNNNTNNCTRTIGYSLTTNRNSVTTSSSMMKFQNHTNWKDMDEMSSNNNNSIYNTTNNGDNSQQAARYSNNQSDSAAKIRSTTGAAAANPNDIETGPTIMIEGRGPGRRAGHTATAVGRYIYVFGGSCGSDYLNDFFFLDTDPPPNAIVTEPTCLQLVERRLRHFTNESKFSDVTFLVEDKPVYGHRLILSTVSDCFRAMFTTGFKESSIGCAVEPIEIPNCSYHAFLSMMEYIYTGQLNLTNGDASTSQGLDHIVQMLELADLFFLEHLKQKCETLLHSIVNLETIDYLAQVAQKTNSPQLSAICSHFQRNIDNSDDNYNSK